jgi:drug/metabolite transporter (DMT)-like permease
MSRALGPNLRGVLWMVAAMAAFSLEDALIKHVTRALPVGQVLMGFGLGGALLFALAARRSQTRLMVPEVLAPAMRVRACFELVGRLFYVLAVALTPLSATTVILQATPVLVVLGGSLVFRERVGALRWAAVVAGLVGVLLILRPGAEAFSPVSLLALVGMAGFAGRDLASRAAPPALGTVHLGFFGFLTVVVAGALFALWDGRAFLWPEADTAAMLAGSVLIGTSAYAALMKAMRTGDIATVTPFRYTRLLFGVGLGVLAFGEPLDTGMLLGSVVIASAGLLIAWDGRQRRA